VQDSGDNWACKVLRLPLIYANGQINNQDESLTVSEQEDVLQQCVTAGLRVMRLNFSHATYEEADLRITNLRKAKGIHGGLMGGKENLRAVLLDTKGPEIRTGNMEGGEVELTKGNDR